MPRKPKKPSLWRRFLSRFSRSASHTMAPDRDQGQIDVASAAEVIHLPSTPLAPEASLSVNDESTPQNHARSPPSIRSTSSRNNNGILGSQETAVSTHGQHKLFRPPQSFPHHDSSAGPMANSSAMSFFSGASNVQTRDIVNYFEAPHLVTVQSVDSSGDKSIDGWKMLLKRTAPNALHNSNARYDAPKCDEDTRVEVIGEITDWIKDRDGPRRLLCMTGAAGSGKSALQQTTAEKCQGSGILGSAFFFAALDPSRNTVERVIPTIAYQLGRTNASLRWWIKAAVEDDPLIFSQSLQAQTTALIVEPCLRCRGAGMDLSTLPHAILIDGLDECKDEARQTDLLVAIKQCLLVDGLPFRIFLASRPELAIRIALEPGGLLDGMAEHIPLSEKYLAEECMRRYLRKRFHNLAPRAGDSHWFTEDDINALVEAGSGQFVYVSTVYKYISEPRASPKDRLKIVLTWTPHEGQRARPFEALDKLYTNILSAAKHAYEEIDIHQGRDFLMLVRAYHINLDGYRWKDWTTASFPTEALTILLGLETGSEDRLFSDLRSLVALKKSDLEDGLELRLYHKSFSDFLEEESRARDLFIPKSCVRTYVAKALMQHLIECPLDLDSLPETSRLKDLPLSKSHQSSWQDAFFKLPNLSTEAPIIDDELPGFIDRLIAVGWPKLEKLIQRVDRDELFGVTTWLRFLRQVSEDMNARSPELAAVMGEFVAKWNPIIKSWAPASEESDEDEERSEEEQSAEEQEI